MIRLCDILNVEEGVPFNLIGLKGHFPEDVFMITNNQLFRLENLSKTTTLGELFQSDYNPDILITIPLAECESTNDKDDEDSNKIGFVLDSSNSNDKDQSDNELSDHDYAIEYLRVIDKYTDYKYITRDKKLGLIFLHSCIPYKEREDTEEEYWDSKGLVSEVKLGNLFDFLETTHYYDIEQLIVDNQ